MAAFGTNTGAFSFGGTGAPAQASAIITPAPLSTTGVQLQTPIVSGGATSSVAINFRQLQELVNKWTIDLDDQEKLFIDLATKVNYWDKTLTSNAEKIAKMSESMERVKSEHERMENIVDYVKSYQREFEGFLETLEANSATSTTTTSERAELYGNMEKLNTDLQQISEDLKEVIRHINISNKLVDRTDPISQIIRILNEHTDALQWMEDQTVVMKEFLHDVTKKHQVFRVDQERSLRLMFKPN